MCYSTDIPDLVVRHYSFIFVEIKAYAKLNCLFGKKYSLRPVNDQCRQTHKILLLFPNDTLYLMTDP